jgi:hypothetical protein
MGAKKLELDMQYDPQTCGPQKIREILHWNAKCISSKLQEKMEADLSLVRERCIEKGMSPKEVFEKSRERDREE